MPDYRLADLASLGTRFPSSFGLPAGGGLRLPLWKMSGLVIRPAQTAFDGTLPFVQLGGQAAHEIGMLRGENLGKQLVKLT